MASRQVGDDGSMLDQAVGAMRSFGASDAMMQMLYNSNPQIRQIVDQYRGQSIDDLLSGVGIDPNAARMRLGINR